LESKSYIRRELSCPFRAVFDGFMIRGQKGFDTDTDAEQRDMQFTFGCRETGKTC